MLKDLKANVSNWVLQLFYICFWRNEPLFTFFRYWQGGASKRDVIINDVDSWIRLALSKYDNDVIIHELRSLSHNYPNEILELCKGAIKAGKMTLAKTYFSVFPPSVRDENTDTESAT